MAMFVNSDVSPAKRRRAFRPMSEINVTPFVDVMLVLLVIFIVTAPLLTTGVEVNLPSASSPNLRQDESALTLVVDKDGNLFLQEEEVALGGLSDRLRAIQTANPDVRVYVRADEALSYGQVMEVMGVMYRGGFRNAALVTQPPRQRR